MDCTPSKLLSKVLMKLKFKKNKIGKTENVPPGLTNLNPCQIAFGPVHFATAGNFPVSN